MDRTKYIETEEQKSNRPATSCLVFHGDGICPKCNQPERSKREDVNKIDEYHKRCAYGPYYDAVL